MWRYLTEAFWAKPEVPGLGRVPVNVVAVAGAAILGFGAPAVWLLALALETTYLFALASHPRFQRLVDAGDREIADDDLEDKRASLIEGLAEDARQRYSDLGRRCDRADEVQARNAGEGLGFGSNHDALEKLRWLYLKLLVARQQLAGTDFAVTETKLRHELADLEADLEAGRLSSSLKESKEATRRIYRKRLANLARRDQTLEEIDSDLLRIDAQVDLALENATIKGKPETISTNINLVSSLLEDAYGDAADTVASLDTLYATEG